MTTPVRFSTFFVLLLVVFCAGLRGDVTGLVLDPQGRPVAGATVHLLGGVPRQARGDSAGRFRFASVPDGAYTLLAASPACR